MSDEPLRAACEEFARRNCNCDVTQPKGYECVRCKARAALAAARPADSGVRGALEVLIERWRCAADGRKEMIAETFHQCAAEGGWWAMSDDIREELEGFVEAWRDDAAQSRDSADLPGPTVAETYDECADELEAFLKRQADAYLAAAGPADSPRLTREDMEVLRQASGDIDVDLVREFSGEDPADDGGKGRSLTPLEVNIEIGTRPNNSEGI